MMMLIGLAMAGLGVYWIIAGIRAKREVEAYEFENTTDGGVVEFPDLKAAKRHDSLVRKGDNLPIAGLGSIVVGGALVALSL